MNNEYQIFYNKGTAYNDEGKYTLAIDNYLKALSINNDSIEIHFNLGIAYINKKEYDLAIDSFNNVLKLNPDEVVAYSNIALAYARNKNYSKSIENYKKVLSYTPDDADTYKDLADVYVRSGGYDLAIENYNTVLKINPCMVQVKKSLETAINLKNQNKPADNQTSQVNNPVYQQTNEKEINQLAQNYFAAGVTCIKEQNIDGAIDNLRNCLKLSSSYPGASDLLNKVLLIKQRMYEAKKNA